MSIDWDKPLCTSSGNNIELIRILNSSEKHNYIIVIKSPTSEHVAFVDVDGRKEDMQVVNNKEEINWDKEIENYLLHKARLIAASINNGEYKYCVVFSVDDSLLEEGVILVDKYGYNKSGHKFIYNKY